MASKPTDRSKPRRSANSLPTRAAWRDRMYQVIFEADTRAGQAFDIFLLVAILLSIVTVSLETVVYFQQPPWKGIIHTAEWILTILFTVEYFARLICVAKPARYAFSFLGLIDLLSWLPLYLLYFGGYQSLMILRSVRLLRVFRVLKMMRMLREAHSLRNAVWRSRDKILVFISVVLIAVTISGTLMYQIEHAEPGSKFSSIPQSMYWAIVTMTTVGYGDITPQTIAGKFVSAVLILLGYSLIIVPTGFVSAEIIAADRRLGRDLTARACAHCLREGHSPDADFCDMCGARLVRLGDHADGQ